MGFFQSIKLGRDLSQFRRHCFGNKCQNFLLKVTQCDVASLTPLSFRKGGRIPHQDARTGGRLNVRQQAKCRQVRAPQKLPKRTTQIALFRRASDAGRTVTKGALAPLKHINIDTFPAGSRNDCIRPFVCRNWMAKVKLGREQSTHAPVQKRARHLICQSGLERPVPKIAKKKLVQTGHQRAAV